jgi:2-oxoglutarate dehydrogenase E2 component (dihydrolipoamide succinyltransferase)
MAIEVTMPQLGESVVEGTVSRWLAAEGETIEEYQPLLEVETDKVNSEIPSPASGVLLKILVPEGATVKVGIPLALIGEPGESLPEIPREPGTARPKGVPEAEVAAKAELAPDEEKKEKPMGRGVVTPVVAKIAAEYGIDLALVDIPGSGRGGRITKKDILAYVERGQVSAPPEEEVPARERPASVVPLTPMRQAIAEHMVRSVRSAPQVTTVMEADLSRVVADRERIKSEFLRREGLKLSYMPFFIQAVIEGLKAVPEANSTFTDEGILLHQQINIGIAVALESGLIVPVIKDADRLSMSGLQRTVADLAARSRLDQLKLDEVQGGTFTVTNHGVSGSLWATPIINRSQAGILGVGAIQKRPVVVTVEGVDSIAIKPMCYLSFSFDHRIMDGSTADELLTRVVAALNNWGG